LLSTTLAREDKSVTIEIEVSSLTIRMRASRILSVRIHYTTGNYNIFIKIHCKDTKHLKDVLHDRIQKVDGIERTETFISLEESLNRHLEF
jgi:DNA-binding Lrp family transcriptional regulator